MELKGYRYGASALMAAASSGSHLSPLESSFSVEGNQYSWPAEAKCLVGYKTRMPAKYASFRRTFVV